MAETCAEDGDQKCFHKKRQITRGEGIVCELIDSLQQLACVKEDVNSVGSFDCVEDVLRHIYNLGATSDFHEYEFTDCCKRQIGSLLLTAIPRLFSYVKWQKRQPYISRFKLQIMWTALECLLDSNSQYRTFPVNSYPSLEAGVEEEKLDTFLTEELQLAVNWVKHTKYFKKFRLTLFGPYDNSDADKYLYLLPFSYCPDSNRQRWWKKKKKDDDLNLTIQQAAKIENFIKEMKELGVTIKLL